jgi:16S rRNA processing protein RimM
MKAASCDPGGMLLNRKCRLRISNPAASRGGGGGGGPPPPPPHGPLTVASSRWHSGRLLVRFAGYADRDSAEDLRGTLLVMDSAEVAPPADPDEFHDYQLIGLSVRTIAGEPVGVVTDVLHQGQDLLVIKPSDRPAAPGPEPGQILVPFVAALVPEVDVKAGQLVIDPPPGLLDLDAAE